MLNKLMPMWFKPAALSQLGSPMPYAQIERCVNRDAAIVLLLVLAAVTFIALKALHVI